jgi:hypothetical protein
MARRYLDERDTSAIEDGRPLRGIKPLEVTSDTDYVLA